MIVLVWKQYGSIDVFPAETVQDCRFIATDVVDIIKGWCCDEFDEDLDRFAFNTAGDDRSAADLRRHLRNLVNDVCEDADDFEDFDFVKMVER